MNSLDVPKKALSHSLDKPRLSGTNSRAPLQPGVAAPRDTIHAPVEPTIALDRPLGNIEGAIAPLSSFLGVDATTFNPAWTPKALQYLRALEKRLLAHALSLPTNERSECMASISVLEDWARLRIRLEQMAMTQAQENVLLTSENAS